MVNVHVDLPHGTRQDIQAREGESIMQAATRGGVPGIIGECGGEMSCATCHVYVKEPWKSKLRKPSEDERDLLETSDECANDSRLSCQIKMKPELDGISISVLPSMV
jgi:2Fe-2S ferredoxin